MENPQMGMPAEMAPQGPNPEEMAIYDQMRQQISPQEFSNEMLAGASQVDPQAVAEFTQELQSLDVSPEELDALNDLVDQILASPEQYDQLRQQFLAQGMPDDILPEQFDPYFFAALNMAVDQMIAAPTGVQAFAQGGIAELKPIAKAIASYGRNGDTMLAHITPAEARMLRRRGGSGTINPATGLPEFFLKKAFKSIGKAVKKFASSSVGRIVTTVALGYFLGPMAVKAMGIASGTMAAAAVTGFVGGAGGSLLAGGNLKDALKSGAIAGLTAGAAAGLGGARLTGAPVVDAPAAVPGLNASGAPAAPVAPVAPGAPAISATGEVANMASVPAPATGAYKAPTVGESFSKMGEGLGMGDKAASFDTFKQGAKELFSPGPTNAQVTTRAQEIMRTTPGSSLKDAMSVASKELSPGLLRTYGPAAVAGTGIMALAGGFESKPTQGGAITQSLMKPVTQRIREEGTQRQMYMQGLPGVVYDEFGAPVFGQSTRLPTYDVPDYDAGGFRSFNSGSQVGMTLPPVYTAPPGTAGSRGANQLYNTSSMYTNIMPPQGYANGGQVQYFDEGGAVAPPPPAAAAPAKTPEQLAAERQTALETMMAQQKAGRDIANQRRAERRAAGSGQMYGNINAGLAALAPENFPGAPVKIDPAREAAMHKNFTGLKSDIDYARVMQEQGYRPEEVAALTGRTFGDINRRFQTAVRQDAAAPMLQGQRDAMAAQRRTLENARGIEFPGSQLPATQPPGTIGAPVTQPPDIQPPGTIGMPVTQPPVTQPPVTQPPVTQPAITNTQITEYLAANPGMTDAQVRGAMDQFGVKVDQMAAATGLPVDQIQQRYDTASKFNNQDIVNFLDANQGMDDRQIRAAMDQFGVGTAQMAAATGLPLDQIQQRYNTAGAQNLKAQQFTNDVMAGAQKLSPAAPVQPPSNITDQDILGFLSANPGMNDMQIRGAMDQYGVDPARMASVTGMPLEQIQQRYNAAAAPRLLNMGGIAGLARGGYPRRTGQISGPGTEKSDSIPAMLSDGEFVMTAKAVRGAGKGSRRAGAKQMYKLMHQLEKNSERG
jgi:uncharacterized protein YneF (UPF0154 family)